jgi:hypothetical protein
VTGLGSPIKRRWILPVVLAVLLVAHGLALQSIWSQAALSSAAVCGLIALKLLVPAFRAVLRKLFGHAPE